MVNEVYATVVNHEKICTHLREELSRRYALGKWTPKFLRKPINALKNRFAQVNVIIQIDDTHQFSNLNSANLGGLLGCTIDHKLDVIGGFSTRVTPDTLNKLVTHEAVVKVWHDRDVQALLDVAAPTVNAPQVWYSGNRGEGVGIAVLDTGIYPHPDLVKPTNRIIAFKDLVNNRSKPYDDNGHGTHCAGDAAGNGYMSRRKYMGSAPRANLIGVKILDKQGTGKMSTILAGIQWCISNKKTYGIDIISMSLGAPAFTTYKLDPLCRAVEKAWKAGIVVCAAAGNEGPGRKTINTPGIDPHVITVGAIDDKGTVRMNGDTIAPFSSRGPTIDGLTKPDVVAPGVNIISLRSPGSVIDKVSKETRVGEWYASFSGTSMATPICAGVVALILEGKRGLKPDTVKSILMSACRTINMDANSQGSGLIDARAAVKQASVHK